MNKQEKYNLIPELEEYIKKECALNNMPFFVMYMKFQGDVAAGRFDFTPRPNPTVPNILAYAHKFKIDYKRAKDILTAVKDNAFADHMVVGVKKRNQDKIKHTRKNDYQKIYELFHEYEILFKDDPDYKGLTAYQAREILKRTGTTIPARISEMCNQAVNILLRTDTKLNKEGFEGYLIRLHPGLIGVPFSKISDRMDKIDSIEKMKRNPLARSLGMALLTICRDRHKEAHVRKDGLVDFIVALHDVIDNNPHTKVQLDQWKTMPYSYAKLEIALNEAFNGALKDLGETEVKDIKKDESIFFESADENDFDDGYKENEEIVDDDVERGYEEP